MKKIMNNKKGFTLMEIIVVLIIMGILLAIAIPSILGYIDKASDAKFMAAGRAINTEANMLIQEQLIKDTNMTDEEFKKLIQEYRKNFIWSGVAGSKNPINDLIEVELPDYYQIRSIEYNFDDKLNENQWVYDENVQNHYISKSCIVLQRTETAGTAKPLQEYLYIVTLTNKNIYVYDTDEEVAEAFTNNPEAAPIYPS